MKTAVLIALLSLALVPVPSAAGVVVHGVVRRGSAAPPAPTAPPRYRERRVEADEKVELPPGSGCQCDPARYAVVWLTGESLPVPTLPDPPPRMAQQDRMFVPSVLAVPVDATVEFPNADPFFHNVFSYSRTRKFDLGRYPKGESAAVVFDKPGIVPIFCEIHYTMRAYIHVLETPYYAVTDEGRRFGIADVAPGTYVLHVWQENLPELRKAIRVDADPVEVEIP